MENRLRLYILLGLCIVAAAFLVLVFTSGESPKLTSNPKLKDFLREKGFLVKGNSVAIESYGYILSLLAENNITLDILKKDAKSALDESLTEDEIREIEQKFIAGARAATMGLRIEFPDKWNINFYGPSGHDYEREDFELLCRVASTLAEIQGNSDPNKAVLLGKACIALGIQLQAVGNIDWVLVLGVGCKANGVKIIGSYAEAIKRPELVKRTEEFNKLLRREFEEIKKMPPSVPY